LTQKHTNSISRLNKGEIEAMSRNEDIIAQNNCTSGKIEKVSKCWWLKVNSKPARLYGLDGALFPYLMTVTYSVNGKKYKKTKCIGLRKNLIGIFGTVNVFYDKDKPSRCAIQLLGG